MKTAYDPKDLIAKMKDQGLPVLEEMAEGAVKATFAWLKESAVVSENKVDDLLSVGYPMAEAQALKLCDKIDGQEG